MNVSRPTALRSSATDPKPRVHFHSDNQSFGGSEQMLVVLLSAAISTGEIQPSFSYRATADYREGAEKRLPAEVEKIGLRLPDPEAWLAALRRRYPSPAARPLRGAARALVSALPIRQVGQLYDISLIARMLKRVAPDLLHVNNGGFPGAASCTAAALAARRTYRTPVVYVVNNLAYGYGSLRRWYEYPLERQLVSAVSVFVTGSRAARDRLAEVLRLPPGKVVSIPNGIREREPDETRSKTRARLGIDDDEVLVVSVGRLEPRKGHRYLIEAFRKHLTAHPESRARLVIDGDGPLRPDLERLIAEVGVASRARIIHPERNVWNLYAACDLVVLPSVSHEDFPNVPLESMASSKPVVASRLAGVPEQVVHGVTGFTVPPGDSEALAAAISTLVASPELRAKMGAEGRRRFVERFTAERAARDYFDLYRSVLEDSRPSRRALT